MTTRWDDKQPGDTIVVEFDFTKDLAGGALSSPEVSIAVAAGTDPSAASMLSGSPQISVGRVYQRVTAGVHGCDYAFECFVNIGADRLSLTAVLPVRDRPVAPGLATRYLTEEQFEQRFTPKELTELLEDGASFARAENDAASLIDAYMASRYAMPLLSVPDIVVGWSADITRFKLWDDHAPEEVRRRYDDAIGQLKDLAAGRLALPPDAAGVPASASSFNTDGYNDERVFTAATLAGF